MGDGIQISALMVGGGGEAGSGVVPCSRWSVIRSSCHLTENQPSSEANLKPEIGNSGDVSNTPVR